MASGQTARSISNATQIVVRMIEESIQFFKHETGQKTGAFPRVNRPFLCEILQNLVLEEVTLTRLILLHEGWSYQEKGREVLSKSCHPERGLREGFATSLFLFHIFNEQAYKIAHNRRIEIAEHENQECGLEWKWRPGIILPANDLKITIMSIDFEVYSITESIFADGSTWTERTGDGDSG